MLISVVVPIYNSRKNLRQCIESILAQTYSNFELILIDDGSSDDSFSICKEYEKLDERVRVFHQKNSGVGSARNKGIAESKGSYVMFVDSDDYLDTGMLQDGINHVGKNEDLYISGTLMEFFDNEKIIRKEEYGGKEQNYTPRTLLENFDVDYPLLCIGGPCSKLFKTELLKNTNCYFDTEMSVSEDSLFCINYINSINTISFSSKCYYHYRRDGEESLWSRYNPNLYEFQCRSYGRMRDVMQEQECSEDALERFEILYFNIMVGCIRNENKNKNTNREKKIGTVKKIANNEYVQDFISSRHILGMRERIVVELIRRKKYKTIVLIYDIWDIWKKRRTKGA